MAGTRIISSAASGHTGSDYFSARNRKLVELVEGRTGVKPQAQKRSEGPVKITPLSSSVAVSKDYGPYEMVYVDTYGPEFRKHPKMVSGHTKPTDAEVRQFKSDIAEAAKTDKAVEWYLNGHPALKT